MVTLKTKEEIKIYFKSYDYEILDEEIQNLKKFYSQIYSQIKKLNLESNKKFISLCQDELEKVSGGFSDNVEKGIIIGSIAGKSINLAIQLYKYYVKDKDSKDSLLNEIRKSVADWDILTLIGYGIGGGIGYSVDVYNKNKHRQSYLKNYF